MEVKYKIKSQFEVKTIDIYHDEINNWVILSSLESNKNIITIL